MRLWAAAAGLVVASVTAGGAAARPWLIGARPPAANPTVSENRLPGVRGWLLPQAPDRAIEGFASQTSVAAGQSVQLHVSTTPAARYRVQVYRLGWYGGRGARLLGCLPGCARSHAGSSQAIPKPDAATGEIRATWPVTDVVRTTRRWTSGYYIAELVLVRGPHAGSAYVVPFVVRSARATPILVVSSVNTWQAYNTWGGKSLYVSLAGDPNAYAHAVSFDRPYDAERSRTVLYWEYPLARFLERNGYDVSYETDTDLDAHPADLLRHRLVVISGHSEYWTKQMFDAIEHARDSGVNVAFIGGNDVYWQARYADKRRTLLVFRDKSFDPSHDPATLTLRFRDLTPPRPECKLVGVEYQGGWESDNVAHSFTVNASALSNPWFKGTGFTRGSVLDGLVGYEWDSVEPGCTPPGLTVLFHYEGTPMPPDRSAFERSFYSSNADVVSYKAPSGARVFATGSIQFAWGLDGFARQLTTGDPRITDHWKPDPRLQRFMRNVFGDLSRRRP